MSQLDYRAVAHFAEGPLPVLVLADLAPVRMGNGKPGRRVQVLRSAYGYSTGQLIRVATALLTVPGSAPKGRTASQRRKDRSAKQRVAGTFVPPTPKAKRVAQATQKPKRQEPMLALRDHTETRLPRVYVCASPGCTRQVTFLETLATGQPVTECPEHRAQSNGL